MTSCQVRRRTHEDGRGDYMTVCCIVDIDAVAICHRLGRLSLMFPLVPHRALQSSLLVDRVDGVFDNRDAD